MAPIRAREAAEKIWNEEFPKFCSAHQGSAHQNADDTASEEGFEMYSERWYQCAVSTLNAVRDNADHVMNPMDPEPGQALMRSEEHTSELQSLMRISYAVFCLKKKTNIRPTTYMRSEEDKSKIKILQST